MCVVLKSPVNFSVSFFTLHFFSLSSTVSFKLELSFFFCGLVSVCMCTRVYLPVHMETYCPCLLLLCCGQFVY